MAELSEKHSSLKLGDLFSVAGKNVVITGGSRGIGFMMAEGFMSNGANVFISARNKEKLQESASKLATRGPGKCTPISCDLSTNEGIKELVNKVSEHTNKIDVLVNNAGVHTGQRCMDAISREDFQEVSSVNVEAPVLLTRELAPLLERAASGSPSRSVVINVSSIAATEAFNGNVAYAASKAAVNILTTNMAAFYAPKGINVNAVSFGVFETDMTKFVTENEAIMNFSKSAHIVGRHGSSGDATGVAIFLASKAGSFVTGANILSDGGYVARYS